MPSKGLHSILGSGSGRVKKSSRSQPSLTRSATWTDSLSRTKSFDHLPPSQRPVVPQQDAQKIPAKLVHAQTYDGSSAVDYLDALDSSMQHTSQDLSGLDDILSDPHLRDIPQTLLHALSTMFTPIPTTATQGGMPSTRITTILNFRRNLPPIVTASHLYASFSTGEGRGKTPTAIEREIGELSRKGVVRRIVVPTRMRGGGKGDGFGGMGEAGEVLVLERNLVRMVEGAAQDHVLDQATRDAYLRFLTSNPGARKVDFSSASASGLRRDHIDQLIRAGFLTSHHTSDNLGTTTRIFATPENRATMLSAGTVSRAATGSIEAVGGQGAVHAAGGSGGGLGRRVDVSLFTGELRVSVPGHGAYLKLASNALARLVDILEKTQFREMPEKLLKERWDGGIATDEKTSEAKRNRREFAGVLPGRTRKWREFSGLAFAWVLNEAVGAGVVELFDARSVGKGVRLLR